MKKTIAGMFPQKNALRIADRSEGRDNNFNLIRILAAGGVLVSHAYPISWGEEFGQPFEITLHGLSLGMVCVWIFFAISGFFITRSFDRKRSATSFLIARCLRLFPALAVVTVITIIIAGTLLTTASASAFWPEAWEFFVRNMMLFNIRYTLPEVFVSNPFERAINGSLWSLSYEVTCYLGVLVCGIFGVLWRKKIFAVLAVLFLGIYAVEMVTDLHGRMEQITRLGLPFLTGMIFYIWRHHIFLSETLLLGAVIVALISWLTPLFLPVFAICLSYAVFFVGYAKIPLLLNYNRLGDYSYGVYIYAFPIQQLVAQTGVTTPIINIAIALPFTILCAVISWHLIEYPAMQLRHRLRFSEKFGAKRTAD